MNRARLRALGLGMAGVISLTGALASAETLGVGPGQPFAAPCAAVAAAHDNDIIEIDAQGDYGGDVCAIAKNGLTLRGVGGRAKIAAQGKSSGGKAIWVVSGHDTTVENVEFSGASVADQNGAGIRQEGDNLSVRNCYFHDNDDGILSNASAQSEILIEASEFARNGFGDGYSHNLYIGNVARFTLRGSYSHDAKVGHLVKSRARENYILYNRLSGEQGSSSYELDLPNAGTSYVIGNLIEQSASTENPTLFGYGLEGVTAGNPGHALYVVNNTFINDRPNGGTFVNIGAQVDTPALLLNNMFFGPGAISNQSTAVQTSNYSGLAPGFVAPGSFDYELLPGSPCVDAGTPPPAAAMPSLVPEWEYVHPASLRMRENDGAIDIGAYELSRGGTSNTAGAAGTTQVAAGAASTTGGASNAAGASSAAAGAAGTDPEKPHDDSNASCGCTAVGRQPASWAWFSALLAAGVFTRRVRRRAHAPE